MKETEMRAIVALMAGMQLAIVHMCNVIDKSGIASKEGLAESFEATAAGVADPVMAIPLRQIAAGIRNSATPEAQHEMQNLLSRLKSSGPPANG